MARTWDQLPLLYGAKAAQRKLRGQLIDAHHTPKRWCVFGDSQETAPGGAGRSYIYWMNERLWHLYGKQSETVIAHPSNYGGGSPPAQWLLRSAVSEASAASITAAEILPNMAVEGFASDSNGHLVMLEWLAEALSGSSAGITGTRYWQTSRPLYATLYARRTSGSSPELAWDFSPRSVEGPSYFDTDEASGTTTGLDLDNADNAFRSEEVGPLSPVSGKPYPQLIVRGSATANAECMGLRFSQKYDPGGITFQSFGVGGYQASNLLGSHGSAGPMLDAFGPWDAIWIQYGANDAYTGGKSVTAFGDDIQAIIDALRGASWLNTTDPLIVLGVEPYRADGSAAVDDVFDQYAGALADIADGDASESTLVVNPRIITDRIGWNETGHETFLADSVHPNHVGSRELAKANMEALYSVAPQLRARMRSRPRNEQRFARA